MSMKIANTATRKLRSTVMFVASFALVLSTVTAALPVFLTQTASAVAPATYTQVPFTQTVLDNNWPFDRTTPSGNYSSADFGGRSDVLAVNVDNTKASPTAESYRTEGLQHQIPASDTIKADLYVDGSWFEPHKDVRAGLWGVAKDSASAISAYPIIEFTTAGDNSFTGWRVFDGVNGGWTNLPVAYTENTWNTLEISLNQATHKFNLDINGTVVTSNAADTTTSIGAVILNDYNYATVTANDYSVRWSNFAYGSYYPTPVCSSSDTTFDNFDNGSVNGQKGWSSTGAYDQEIISNNNGFASLGCKSLRLSNAVTTGGFGDQTFSYSTPNEAGETSATNGGQSSGSRQNHFEAQFDIASTSVSTQPGLVVSVSPDRGDGSRMSYLRFVDTSAGVDVYFDDVQGTSAPANFVETKIATLSRTAPHTIKFAIDYANGASNDVVKVSIDRSLVHTGTTWENYYRFDPEAKAEQSTRTTDSLLFRAGGTAVPATSGSGFLFDNVNIATSTLLPSAPVKPPVALPTAQVVPVAPIVGAAPYATVAPVIAAAATTPAGEILGASTAKQDAPAVAGAETSKDVVAEPTAKDGFNSAWYWLLTIPVAGAAWWALAAFRRRES